MVTHIFLWPALIGRISGDYDVVISTNVDANQ